MNGQTGEGRWRRAAASFSPGDSNATAGAPNVTPTSDASPPPKEWPRYKRAAIVGITSVIGRTCHPYIRIWIHVRHVIV